MPVQVLGVDADPQSDNGYPQSRRVLAGLNDDRLEEGWENRAQRAVHGETDDREPDERDRLWKDQRERDARRGSETRRPQQEIPAPVTAAPGENLPGPRQARP